MKRFVTLASVLLLSACQQTITASPTPLSIVPAPVANTIQDDLLAAENNLQQAMTIGALPSTDPAYACVHAVNTQLGIEPAASGTTPPASFTPANKGLASAGSILYIQVQQLKKLTGQTPVAAASCQQLIGQLVIDGVQFANRAALVGAGAAIALPVKLP